MRVTKEMGSAALKAAIGSGLIKKGVTHQQQLLMEQVIQAALDAHPTLKLMEQVSFLGTEAEAFPAVSAGAADAVHG